MSPNTNTGKRRYLKVTFFSQNLESLAPCSLRIAETLPITETNVHLGFLLKSSATSQGRRVQGAELFARGLSCPRSFISGARFLYAFFPSV